MAVKGFNSITAYTSCSGESQKYLVTVSNACNPFTYPTLNQIVHTSSFTNILVY